MFSFEHVLAFVGLCAFLGLIAIVAEILTRRLK